MSYVTQIKPSKVKILPQSVDLSLLNNYSAVKIPDVKFLISEQEALTIQKEQEKKINDK